MDLAFSFNTDNVRKLQGWFQKHRSEDERLENVSKEGDNSAIKVTIKSYLLFKTCK